MTSQHQEEDEHDQQDCEEDGYGTPLAPIWKAGHRGDLPEAQVPKHLRSRGTEQILPLPRHQPPPPPCCSAWRLHFKHIHNPASKDRLSRRPWVLVFCWWSYTSENVAGTS